MSWRIGFDFQGVYRWRGTYWRFLLGAWQCSRSDRVFFGGIDRREIDRLSRMVSLPDQPEGPEMRKMRNTLSFAVRYCALHVGA